MAIIFSIKNLIIVVEVQAEVLIVVFVIVVIVEPEDVLSSADYLRERD